MKHAIHQPHRKGNYIYIEISVVKTKQELVDTTQKSL
jgi:hypothetical protein